MISEMGSLGVSGNKVKWFSEALAIMLKKYPTVLVIIFFNNSNNISSTYKSFGWFITADMPVL